MSIPFIKGLWPMLIRFALAKPFRVAREFDVELIVACLINTAYIQQQQKKTHIQEQTRASGALF